MWIKILCIEYILRGIPTIESTFDVANMVKTATVKDVPMNNDALLNIQAHEKKLATVTAHSELTVTKIVTASPDWAVT